jgi:hypothetical protein
MRCDNEMCGQEGLCERCAVEAYEVVEGMSPAERAAEERGEDAPPSRAGWRGLIWWQVVAFVVVAAFVLHQAVAVVTAPAGGGGDWDNHGDVYSGIVDG